MQRAESDAAPIFWPDEGPPRSRLYGDLYYSRDDGLAEARTVFLAGCGLPQAWAGRRRFCVAELGFGTGLNIAALLELWARDHAPRARLSIFSVEAHPVAATDAARALAAWPDLAPLAEALTARWPPRARGFHRIDLPEFDASLDLAVMEAAPALQAWSGAADAWFLDGFAPAANPEMWRKEVLDRVAGRSGPGARLATYTVAGAVRRDLAEAGFAVERRPGFGRKRERLEAHWPGRRPQPAGEPTVAVIGAGIAGASLARALRDLGVGARVFAPAGRPQGPRVALVSPRLDAGLGAQAALFAQACARARDVYLADAGCVIARGALQLAVGAKDAGRFAAIAGSDLFDAGQMRLLDAPQASAALGEAVPPGLLVEGALVIDPGPVIEAWLGEVTAARITAVEHDGEAWRLLDQRGAAIASADVVCIAAGMASADLADGLPLTPVRGQASLARGVRWPQAAVFGAYAIPARDGVVFGATHDRGERDAAPRDADHRRNLAALAAVLPELATRLEGRSLEACAGVRATTADYLPIAGPVPGVAAGLFALTGLGSRGFTLAPLLAEHIAANAVGAPSPLPRDLAALADPARFAERARRRGR